MKPVLNKNEQNVASSSQDVSSSTTQDKAKLKRKIVNSFKKLSLSRSKSYGNQSNNFKSDSESSILKNSNFEKHKNKEQATDMPRLACVESSSIYSEINLPCTSHTISQSVIIVPNNAKSLINQNELITDKKTTNLLFNPADLPAISENEPTLTNKRIEHNLSHYSRKTVENIIKNSVNDIINIVPTTCLSDNNSLNLHITLGIKEILEVTNFFQENEIHLKHLISKYIRNENFQKELFQAMLGHGKIQIEAERRAHKLATEIFVQETDILKNREQALQNSLDIVVNINRLLEAEIECLKSENEKIIIDYDNDSPSCAYHKKYEEDLLKNNNELRTRLKYLLKELSKHETESKNFKDKNEYLINQLANANSQIRIYKDQLQKTVANHEIELAALTEQLNNSEQTIRDSIDAGDTLTEDLEAIKRQLKTMPFALNWTKFKCRGSSVVDLLHLARSCINELCRELINTYVQITFQKKDSETQNLEIMKLNQELKKVKSNDKQLLTEVENLSALEIQIQVQLQKTLKLQSELDMSKKENSLITERFYQEKNTVSNLTKNIEELTIQLTGKDFEIKTLNIKLHDAITENSTLKCQLDSMKKLLEESKISNVLAELLETQEKCAYYQAQYYQLELEKNNLNEVSKKFDQERNNLLKYQQSYFEHLQLQQKDIADLSKQNIELKEQLKQEREQLLERTAQLSQQLQEGNVMKTIQSQFTSEFSKNQALESNALSTNFEVNRLTVVAEYNNIISQQLKNAINVKDKTISEMKSSLEQLNSAEKKSAEDKAALCQELTEASCIVKQLEKDLKTENFKVQQISVEKDVLKKQADVKIEELHKMLIDERQATRELINDHKNITTQRKNLILQQKGYLSQIDKLKLETNKLTTLNEQYEKKCLKYEEQCYNLTKELQEVNKIIEQKQRQSKNEITDYENKLSLRDNLIQEMKFEKEKLENSVKYLQCNLQKLQNDINDLLAKEKQYKDEIAFNLDSLAQFQQQIKKQNSILTQYDEKQKNLEDKLNETVRKHEELLDVHNDHLKQSKLREDTLTKELKSYKMLNKTKTKSIECLVFDAKSKLKFLEQRQSEYDNLKAHLLNFEKLQKELTEKSKLLEKTLDNQHTLNEKLSKMAPENENCHKKIKELSNLVNLLNSQLELSVKSRENELTTCQSFINELFIDTKNQNEYMLNDLNNLTSQFNDLNSKYTEKCLKYHSLKSNFKDLADELTKTADMLMKETFLRQKDERELKATKIEIQELKSKLEYSNNYMSELNEIKAKATTIFEQGDSLQNELEEMKKLYSAAKVDCKILQTQLQETIEKLHKFEKNSSTEESLAIKELELRTALLQNAEKNIEALEIRVRKLRSQMQTTNEVIIQLKSEISHLCHKVQCLEFQKCELTLRYHELNCKYMSEKNLNATLKESHQHLLASVCELNMEKSVTRSVSQTMMLSLK